MQQPERNYQKADLKVSGNNGNLIDISKKVKITGIATFSDDPTYTSGPVYYVKVYKIEQ